MFYTDRFVLPLPDGHRFPMTKYVRLREAVEAAPWAARALQVEGRIRRAVVLDCDVHQGNGTAAICDGDEPYLAALATALDRALADARPDIAFYLAGADPYHGDRWGRLGLTKQGLAARDRLVFGACRAADVPVAVSMAGGYALRVSDIVDIHLETVRLAVGASA